MTGPMLPEPAVRFCCCWATIARQEKHRSLGGQPKRKTEHEHGAQQAATADITREAPE